MPSRIRRACLKKRAAPDPHAQEEVEISLLCSKQRCFVNDTAQGRRAGLLPVNLAGKTDCPLEVVAVFDLDSYFCDLDDNGRDCPLFYSLLLNGFGQMDQNIRVMQIEKSPVTKDGDTFKKQVVVLRMERGRDRSWILNGVMISSNGLSVAQFDSSPVE